MEDVTLDELKESFSVDVSWPKTIGWVKTFTLREKPTGILYAGRLYWDANDGFTIYWDNEKAPEIASRPEFEYTLDSITNDPWFIPPYGDLSDAGMDGA
jgi:hypothetical protein